MSYEIVYDRSFVRTARGIIPMILHGSNNVTEMIRGKEVLQRYWSCYNDTLVEFPENELHQSLVELFGDTLNDAGSELFKWHSKWLHGNQLENWFQAGVRNAATIEEIRAENYGASIGLQVMGIKPHEFDSILRSFRLMRTTEELEKALDESRELVDEEKKEGRDAYLHLFFIGREPLRKPKRTKINEPCLIKCKYGYFGEADGKYGVTYYADPQKARVFANEEEAIDVIGKWLYQRRVPYRVVKASSIFKEKPFVLFLESGPYGGYFIQRRTSRRIYFTKDAKQAWRFDSSNRANQAVEKIRHSFNVLGEISVIENK